MENLAENMQLYPSDLIITGSELMFEYDSGLILDCMRQLQPEKACIFFSAREFADICDQVEPWFKTNYKVEDIPSEWSQSWKNLVVDKSSMFLPEPNKFIAKDLSLKKPQESSICPKPTK